MTILKVLKKIVVKTKNKIKLHPANEHFANILEKNMAQRYVAPKK